MKVQVRRLLTRTRFLSARSVEILPPCLQLSVMRRYYYWPVVLSATSLQQVHSFVASPNPTSTTGFLSFSSKRSKMDDSMDFESTTIDNHPPTVGGEFPNEYSTTYHAPVMWSECVQALLECERSRLRHQDLTESWRQGYNPLVFVDGTLGGGGHSAALLERLQPGDIVLGCDVDPNALKAASQRLASYMDHDGMTKPHFIPVQSNFGDLTRTLPSILHPVTQNPVLPLNVMDGTSGVDGLLLDLGVSSHQIDTPERGFAFMKDGPLDMRMGTEAIGGVTAADLCNELDGKELQRIFTVYGDESRAKTIAKAIIDHRPLHTTQDLVDAIASVTPAFAKNKRNGLTATCARIFQSLRIVVNQEDRVLKRVLAEGCPALIRKGGRLVVLSYHSMEDRATKRIMRDGTLDRVKVEKDMYGNIIGPTKPFKPVGKRQTASEDEVAVNSRARSASLRIAERL